MQEADRLLQLRRHDELLAEPELLLDLHRFTGSRALRDEHVAKSGDQRPKGRAACRGFTRRKMGERHPKQASQGLNPTTRAERPVPHRTEQRNITPCQRRAVVSSDFRASLANFHWGSTKVYDSSRPRGAFGTGESLVWYGGVRRLASQVSFADEREIGEFVGWARGRDTSVEKKHGAMANPECLRHVVIRQKNSGSSSCERSKQLAESVNRRRIHSRKRLVTHQDLRLAGHRSRELQPPPFASRELPCEDIQLFAQSDTGCGSPRVPAGRAGNPTERFEILANREIPEDARSLWHVANPRSCSPPERPSRDVVTPENHLSAIRRKFADQGSEERGLSCAGGTENTHCLTGTGREIDSSQYLLATPV